MENPFKLTRAADLNDDQIVSLWVDPNDELANRLRPSSQLPMIILGGKGSGKTHLMRYHSYAIQEKLHGKERMHDIVQERGYIGVYGRCSGLNADRFNRKNFDDEQWHSLFAFYLELWIGQLILQTIREYICDSDLGKTFIEEALVDELFLLFDRPPPKNSQRTLVGFAALLRASQRELDLAVNNASLGEVRMPEITISSGSLIFGVARTVAKYIKALSKTVFTLFIDEYEHLPERAQRYFNTLVRERENPVTFKIGARLYGFRTFQTFSGDEELREGSEYELLNLDETLRQKEEAYENFALNLCLSRIRFALNGKLPPNWTEANAISHLEHCFERAESVEERTFKKLSERKELSPWLINLEKALCRDLGGEGGISDKDIKKIIFTLKNADPLIEKTNTFLLYRAWSRKENLDSAAIKISESAQQYSINRDKETTHWRVLDKFRDDLRAQMIDELGLPQIYTGLRTWIRMSDGIARNLITILKHVYDWASFHQENILIEGGISLRSQTKGVEDASEWFLNDTRVLGRDLVTVKSGLNRICSLLRILRFSEKPPECSLSTFEIDTEATRVEFTRILRISQHWSLFIQITDRPDRNSSANVLKYRISGMIAPIYGLPLYTRGSIHLSTIEASSIFGGAPESEFAKIARIRESRARPPFRALDANASENESSEFLLF